MNISTLENEATIENDDNLWILKLGWDIFIYLIGTYINWKILIVSQKTKDKTWKEDMVHCTSMMIAMLWTVAFENVSRHVKVLSMYTGGVWICYLSVFVYAYNTFIGGFHSFCICFMKYIYIVHHEKVRVFGVAKLEKIFFLTYIIHPLILTIPTVVLIDVEAYSSIMACFDLEQEIKDRYPSDWKRMFLCRLTFEEGDTGILYYLAQIFCTLKIIWTMLLGSNIAEAFMYYKIFQFMRR